MENNSAEKRRELAKKGTKPKQLGEDQGKAQDSLDNITFAAAEQR